MFVMRSLKLSAISFMLSMCFFVAYCKSTFVHVFVERHFVTLLIMQTKRAFVQLKVERVPRIFIVMTASIARVVWASKCFTWKYCKSFFRRVKRACSQWFECVAIFANATLFCSRMFHSDQLSDIKFEQMKFLTTNSKFQLNIELVLINTKLQNFSLEQYGWPLSDCPILVNPRRSPSIIDVREDIRQSLLHLDQTTFSFYQRFYIGDIFKVFQIQVGKELSEQIRGNTMVMS